MTDIVGRILNVADLDFSEIDSALGHVARAVGWRSTEDQVATFNNFLGAAPGASSPSSVFANFAAEGGVEDE